MEDIPAPRPYRHGNLPNAMRAAARTLLDEAGPEGVGLREAARRVGVSATAAYRYFASKEDLLASVAAEGFRELAAALKAAADSGDPVSGIGPAYVDFALKKRGLFRLMFGPLLADRERYPALNEAVNEAFDFLQKAVTGAEGTRQEDSPATLAAWGLVHGLSTLFIDGLVPESRARLMAEQILVRSNATKPGTTFAIQ